MHDRVHDERGGVLLCLCVLYDVVLALARAAEPVNATATDRKPGVNRFGALVQAVLRMPPTPLCTAVIAFALRNVPVHEGTRDDAATTEKAEAWNTINDNDEKGSEKVRTCWVGFGLGFTCSFDAR